MHLYQMRLVDFRRFEDGAINLDAKMVAILGPNESGKSSLLEALALFNDESPVPPVSLRRGTDGSGERLVGQLTFRLSDSERAAIPYDLPGSDALWLRVSKYVDGRLGFSLEPAPHRPWERGWRLKEHL